VWGAHGANAVHFSVLQEYLAGCIGVHIGKLYQFSNNYHIYESMREKLGKHMIGFFDPYDDGTVTAMPMAMDWSAWDADLASFMTWHDSDLGNYRDSIDVLRARVSNEWFASVAGRVALARWEWTHGFKSSARETALKIEATDWRRACVEWMDRRSKCQGS
jgi:hypothetical protein